MAIDTGSKPALARLPAHAEPSARETRVRAAVATGILVVGVGVGILFGDALTVGAVIAIAALLYLFRALVFSWRGAAVALVAIVCLVPAKRYTLPINLPFAAEPYRLVILLVLAAIVLALIVDPAFRWRRMEMSAPIGVFLATQVISIAVNIPGIIDAHLAPEPVTSMVSFLIICALFVATRQLLRSRRIVQLVLTTTVLSGALVGALATVERVTRVNVFMEFFALLPLHRLSDEQSNFVKAGTARAFGPSQHPIALAVFLVMLVPLGVYLARRADWPRSPAAREFFWIACTMVILLGMLSAVSRTAFVSIGVMAIVTVLLRPVILPRLLFYGVLGAGAALVVSARNVIGMVSELLNPQELIESQLSSPGWTGSGRLADLGPSLELAASQPFFGSGLGSRVTIGPTANAFILDNQYLTTLLESGAVGVLGVAILLLAPAARLAAFSRRSSESDELRDLALAVTISIVGYGVALFFFDGFSFVQTLLTFFFVLAIGSWTVSGKDGAESSALAPSLPAEALR